MRMEDVVKKLKPAEAIMGMDHVREQEPVMGMENVWQTVREEHIVKPTMGMETAVVGMEKVKKPKPANGDGTTHAHNLTVSFTCLILAV